MSLKDKGEPPRRVGSNFGFAVAADEKNLAILVTREAVAEIEPPGGDCLDRFNRNRSAFLTIASRKFERGLLEPDGSVLVFSSDVH